MSAVRGKVAVVTGAGSGIGRALALGLAERGARLALSDIGDEGLAETVRQCRAVGAEVHQAALDVGDRAAVAAYAQAVADHYGVVHQVYNNAGVGDLATPLVETDYAVFERVLRVNLWGVVHGTKEFLPHLVASGDGHVVNVSSLNGFMGQAYMAPYCASKFAVRGFTEALRAEARVEGYPVRVTVVHPGGVRTNISTAALALSARLTPERRARAERRTRVYNETLFRTTPADAARTVLDGVEAGRERVLIGNDARAVDLGVRAFPAFYSRVVAWWERRTFGDPAG